MTRTVAVIQARTGSTRLPGKVLLPLLGMPVLAHVVRRVGRAARVDQVVVATTTSPADDPIVALAAEHGWAFTRGSEQDLLERYLEAARAYDADRVVRITSDCPLVDPDLIDDVLDALDEPGVDYAGNSLEPRTYPRGLDVEAMTMAALERAAVEDHDPASREHATPYIYRHPEIFRLRRVASPVDLSRHRWTLDTPQDYELLRRIVDHIDDPDAPWTAVLRAVEAHPAWSEINRDVHQKPLLP